mgnify:CR=1 FL=1|jgi:ubiquinone/menaquinone biosynthesis C-methylase UbiE
MLVSPSWACKKLAFYFIMGRIKSEQDIWIKTAEAIPMHITVLIGAKNTFCKGAIMNKQNIIEFFDRLAPNWDDGVHRDDNVINTILDNAGITEKVSVLDVGCGTGVLISDYLKRSAAQVTGIDISEKMIKIAKEKFPDPRVLFICGDAETIRFGKTFDCCVIYNAFPHFPEPYSLIKNLAASVKQGGKLTIAHGSSRESIDRHHMEHAGSVSLKLMSDDELASLLAPYFDISVNISNSRMQQIVGVKK